MSDLTIGLAGARPQPGANPAAGIDPATDQRARCPWGASTLDYAGYHDHEWGRATDNERLLFEKLCLEGFQSGLSWLTILRKRDAFRQAFAGFDPEQMAAFGDDDVERLLADSGIVRHRGKIEAVIGNARGLVAMQDRGETLADLVWSFEPPTRPLIDSMADVPSQTPESVALSKALKQRGFSFVGPTTAYAAMQAMGVVNDHLAGCWVKESCEASRAELGRPAPAHSPQGAGDSGTMYN